MINLLRNIFEVKKMSKRARKVAVWAMLILMVGSIVAGFLAYIFA